MLLGFFLHFILSWVVREQPLPFNLLSICAQFQGKNISTEFCFVGFILYMGIAFINTNFFIYEDVY